MARPPHQDQQTLGSYKRTLNAAVLLLAQRASRSPPGGAPRRITMAVMTLLVGYMLGATPEPFSQVLPYLP